MLQYSKFVNTKAQQKATGQRAKRFELPDISRPDMVSAERRRELLDKAAAIAAEAQQKQEQQKQEQHEVSKVHGSVNLEEMQRLEELRKQDEDWLSFFMGKPEGPVIEEPARPDIRDWILENEEIAPAIMTPMPQLEKESSSETAAFVEREASVVPVISTCIFDLDKGVVLDEQNSGPTCLNQIFDELIKDDKIFSRSCDQ